MEAKLPLSDQAAAVLQLAANEAQVLGHDNVGPIHILMGIASLPRTSGYFLLEQADISPALLYSRLKEACANPAVLPSENSSVVIEHAQVATQQRGSSAVCVDDLLLHSLQCAGPAISAAFAKLGLSVADSAGFMNRIWQDMIEKGRAAQMQKLATDLPP